MPIQVQHVNPVSGIQSNGYDFLHIRRTCNADHTGALHLLSLLLRSPQKVIEGEALPVNAEGKSQFLTFHTYLEGIVPMKSELLHKDMDECRTARNDTDKPHDYENFTGKEKRAREDSNPQPADS